MSYQIQAKGTLDFPHVDPKDSEALGSYFRTGEEQYQEFYKELGGRPNAQFFAARMTLLNALSDHKNGPRMVLNVEGANLASLIGKPVHFTDDFEEHWTTKASKTRSREIKTFGVTLGGRLGKVENDGSIPLDVFGLLWGEDHPEAVKAVASNLSEMGMSWEISAPHDALRQIKHPSIPDPILFISQCEFTGTAILKRGSAAYPASQLLVAGEKGNDVELDFSSIPVLDGKKTELQTSKASSASPQNGDPTKAASNNPNPTIIINTGGGGKEKPMGKFCADCKPEYEGRLSRGEIISKEDLEKQQVVADLKASADAAEAKTKLAEEAQKTAEDEVAKIQAEKVHLEKVAEVETAAIKEWEAVKTDFGDDSKIRELYLRAQEKILLGESIESVTEGFKELQDLDKKKPTKKAASSGKRLSAFENHESSQELDDEAKAGSAKIMKEKFNETSLRSFMKGEGFNPHEEIAGGEGN